jgi:hypothetical protein
VKFWWACHENVQNKQAEIFFLPYKFKLTNSRCLDGYVLPKYSECQKRKHPLKIWPSDAVLGAMLGEIVRKKDQQIGSR